MVRVVVRLEIARRPAAEHRHLAVAQDRVLARRVRRRHVHRVAIDPRPGHRRIAVELEVAEVVVDDAALLAIGWARAAEPRQNGGAGEVEGAFPAEPGGERSGEHTY